MLNDKCSKMVLHTSLETLEKQLQENLEAIKNEFENKNDEMTDKFEKLEESN